MSIRIEEIDLNLYLDKLKNRGWGNGSVIVGIKEKELVPFFFDKILRGVIYRINYEILTELTSKEEEEIIQEILDRLNGDNEVRILQYLKHGIGVYLRKRQHKVTIRLIDFDKPENNLFFYLVRPRFRGSPDDIEPDVVLYINGIPIVVIEVKRLIEFFSYQEALRQIRRYEEFSPELFRFVQFGIAIGDEERLTPTWPNWSREERNAPSFKWIVREKEEGRLREYDDATYILEPTRLLEYLRYFVFFRKERGGELGKIIARYNQYYAAKKAMDRVDSYMAGGELNHGLIWHWLGSGKTYTMFFIASYFIDKYWDRRPIVFFVVDRSDLEEQHEKVLKNIEEPNFTKLFKKIDSIGELHRKIKVIKENEYLGGTIAYGVYLTTIQKFQRGPRAPETNEVEEFRVGLLDILKKLGAEYLEWLSEEKPEEYEKCKKELENLKGKDRDEYLIKLGQVRGRNVLLLIDEAHRTQYGILAAMRKTVFPNALAFGFTGTPVFKHERNTFLEFAYPDRGELYLDVYFIRNSIRDGFTLPLAYQAVSEGEVSSEGVRIKLSEDDIKGFIEEYMKGREAGIDVLDHLDPSIYRKVGRYINKVRVFLMNRRRIDELAKYIAGRLEEDTDGFKFKAMVVAVNRLACVRFKHSLDKYLAEKYGEQAQEWTEVVMTYNYNDRDREIVSYRESLQRRFGTGDMNEINKEIQRKFLEEENPRILVVTDMLITGFDAPILKVMYLDKPLYEHRLLQAIARVNRPYPDKEFGLIVDSVGLLEHLSKTLSLYNMLADEEARRDLEENLMERLDEKVEEFIHLYNSVKQRLSKLTLGGHDASVDLDELKIELGDRGFDKREFEARIGIIALFASSKEPSDDAVKAKRLLNDMRRTLKLYKALGSHPKKLLYVEEMEVLTFVYGSILKKMRKKADGLRREFWRDLIKLIHSKTVVEEFERVAEAEIDDKTLDQLLKSKAPRLGLKRDVADFYFYLYDLLAANPHDPIYREIMRRLEKLHREWITRKIDLRTFLAQMKSLEDERNDYEKRIRGKPIEEKIGETINTYIKNEIVRNPDLHLKLERTKREIRRLLKKKLTPTLKTGDRKRLSSSLLKDLFQELQDRVDEKELAKLADRLVNEFIVKELERALRNAAS